VFPGGVKFCLDLKQIARTEVQLVVIHVVNMEPFAHRTASDLLEHYPVQILVLKRAGFKPRIAFIIGAESTKGAGTGSH